MPLLGRCLTCGGEIPNLARRRKRQVVHKARIRLSKTHAHARFFPSRSGITGRLAAGRYRRAARHDLQRGDVVDAGRAAGNRGRVHGGARRCLASLHARHARLRPGRRRHGTALRPLRRRRAGRVRCVCAERRLRRRWACAESHLVRTDLRADRLRRFRDIWPAGRRHLAMVHATGAASRSRLSRAGNTSPARSGRRCCSTSSRRRAGARRISESPCSAR